MKILILVLVCFLLLSTFPPPAEASRTSVQSASQLNQQEVMGESIRHGKKKRKNKNGLGRSKKRRKPKNPTTRRFVEKQYLVHNRTVALLGDDVQKILLNSRALTAKLPYYRPVDSGSISPGTEPRLKLLNPSLANGLKVSQERHKEETSAIPVSVHPHPLDTLKEEGVGQVNFPSALAKLISALSSLPTARSSAESPCEKWLDCRDNLEEIFLGPLPSCPCSYPSEIFYEDKIWDDEQQRYYRWRDASSESERLDIYKPGAEYCIRSKLADGSTSLSVQHCCYDRERNLITRGSGAGNPNYISPDVSHLLHEKIDLLPWKLCKGDFTRYNKIRPPNNGNHCSENPNDDIYEKQVKLAKFF